MTDPAGFAYGNYTTATTSGEMVGKKSQYNKVGASTLKIVDNDTTKSTADRLANSSLWLKVSAKTAIGFKGPNMESTGGRMPNDGTVLTAAELQKIKDWICTDAK